MATPVEEISQILSNQARDVVIPERLLQFIHGKSRENHYLERRMQKVPPLLRMDKNNQQEYDPLVVSLGPYHHGKPELQSAEDFKWTALEMFVADSGKSAQDFYFQVVQRVNDARNCYIEDSTKEYDDPTFALMMLLDACFIINYILLETTTTWLVSKTKYLDSLVWSMAFRDLFLLENQIPFWLLKFLMCERYGKVGGEVTLNNFLNRTLFGEDKGRGVDSRVEEQPLHLPDALRLVLVSDSPKDKPTTRKPKSGNGSGCLSHFPDFGGCSDLHKCISNLPCFPWRIKNDEDYSCYKKYVHCFRSAMDLKAKGIHFRPRFADSLTGIKFKSGYFYATLEVPTCFVTIYSKGIVLNIIAFEMLSTSTLQVVTAYTEFMKSLIDNPKDVKELREKGILLTALGSDEEVVKIFKECNTYGTNDITIFNDVKKEIQAHYTNKAKTWLAELFHTYFRSPWTAIGLFAAAFLLLLTFLQTYYTVRPS